MKRKLKQRLVEVKVVNKFGFLYSVDGLNVLKAEKGDIIGVPSWMAKAFGGKNGKVTTKFTKKPEPDDTDTDVDPNADKGDDDPKMTVAELKAMNEVDFAEMEDTAALDAWAKEHLAYNIPNHYKRETAIRKIFEKIATLKIED